MAPNAVYGLVQTVLVQDEALRRADSRIQELEAATAPRANQSGGFLNSMRETIFGRAPRTVRCRTSRSNTFFFIVLYSFSYVLSVPISHATSGPMISATAARRALK